MKKLMFVLLILFITSCNKGNHNQEELIDRVKSVCSLGDYDNFVVESEKIKNITYYNMEWSQGNKRLYVNAADNGLIYYYSVNRESENSTDIYNEEDIMVSADNFLKKALGNEYENIKYAAADYSSSDIYTFYYNIYCNDVDTNERVMISVDSHTKDIVEYEYPEEVIMADFKDFEGLNELAQAKAEMENRLSLGYVTNYDSDTGVFSSKLVYKFDCYSLKAKDLTSYDELNRDMFFDDATGLDTLSFTAVEGIAKSGMKKSDALSLVRNALGINLPEDINVKYFKADDGSGYALTLYNDLYSVNIDSNGRIVDFISHNSYKQRKLTDVEYTKKAEDIIKGVNTEGYEFTTPKLLAIDSEGEINAPYHFVCNVMRNGYISFDETADLYLDGEGNLISLKIIYRNDEIFGSTVVNIDKNKALDIAFNNTEFKPYYYIDLSDNESYIGVPVYAFSEKFTVNAENGDINKNMNQLK